MNWKFNVLIFYYSYSYWWTMLEYPGSVVSMSTFFRVSICSRIWRNHLSPKKLHNYNLWKAFLMWSAPFSLPVRLLWFVRFQLQPFFTIRKSFNSLFFSKQHLNQGSETQGHISREEEFIGHINRKKVLTCHKCTACTKCLILIRYMKWIVTRAAHMSSVWDPWFEFV